MNEFDAIAEVAATLIVAKPDGRVTYVNASGTRLLGDIVGRDLRDIIVGDSFCAILDSGHLREWKGEVTARNARAALFDASVVSTPVSGPDGNVGSIVIILQDVTREKAEREALAQSERMVTLGELVAGASHELNNPLAIITGYAELLLEDSRLAPDQRSKVESILKGAMRASAVVHGLRAFARKGRPERLRAEVNLIVRAAIRLKEYDLRNCDIRVTTDFPPGLPPVCVDPKQIQQVLLNILNNARDAVLSQSSQREIRITTQHSDGMVTIRILDSGPGISRNDLKRVFDPFFTTKPVGQGKGLGLSTSYGIIREHNGDILISSRPGATEVSILLPVYDGARRAIADAPEIPGRVRLRILVVDDEREIGIILHTGLTRMGFVVECAESAAEALRLAKSSTYDFVLTDIRMPGGSGFDLFTDLCSIDAEYRNRTIFLTGDAGNPATLQKFEDEGLHYFFKPFDFPAIERFLRLQGPRRLAKAATSG